MYIPDHFRPSDDEVLALLRDHGAVDLITVTAKGLLATLLPMAWDEPGSRPGLGAHGALLGHVAIKNDQWREPALGEAMAKREHGRVVPTWNYVTIHAYGRLAIHEEATWLEANVRRLTALHEAAREAPWSVDDAPSEYIAGQLRAIVGLELLIDRLEAKSKLSQNRSAADIDGVIAGLEADGRPEVAGAMRVIRAR